MVDTIKELSDLSHKLNQKSDKLNVLISSMNEKLAAFNFGVEAWLIDPITAGDPNDWDMERGCQTDPERDATLLGYCKVEDQWQLATQRTTLVEKTDERGETYEQAKNSMAAAPLLKASREVRAKAMRLIPRLLDLLKDEAVDLLASIEDAEKAVKRLHAKGGE